MIQRAVTAIIGVVLGLFATFAVFSAILAGLDSFYLLTQDACNYGSDNSPKRILRFAPQNEARPGEADDIDWTADGLGLGDDGAGGCVASGDVDADATYLAPNGDVLRLDGVATTRQEETTRTSVVTVPPDITSDREARVVPGLTLNLSSRGRQGVGRVGGHRGGVGAVPRNQRPAGGVQRGVRRAHGQRDRAGGRGG